MCLMNNLIFLFGKKNLVSLEAEDLILVTNHSSWVPPGPCPFTQVDQMTSELFPELIFGVRTTIFCYFSETFLEKLKKTLGF